MVNRIRSARPDIRITWIIGKIEHQLLNGMDGVEFVIENGEACYQLRITQLYHSCIAPYYSLMCYQ